MTRRARSVIAVVLVMLFTISSAFADCNPRGFTPFGPQTGTYDYLANNVFDFNCAWNYLNAVRKSDGAMWCGTQNYVQFNHPNPNPGYYVSQVYQVFHVPQSGEPGFISNSTSWLLGFVVQVNDPLASSSNLLYVTVLDNDTRETIAFGPVLRGSDSAGFCGTKIFNFSANLNGRNVQVLFLSYVYRAGAYFNVTNVECSQHT